MRCLADYEIRSEVRVVDDGKRLKLIHPAGNLEFRVKNGASPTTLSMQVIFDAPELKGAREIADRHYIDTLNLLAFITCSRFEYGRLLKIVDWTPDLEERHAMIYAGLDPESEPEPLLDDAIFASANILLQAELAPPLKRAFRWFRLGILAEFPDEMFQCFYFAIEIIADFQKNPTKVHDKCPKCNGDLYCHTCDDYPTHRPYPWQAIRDLVIRFRPKDGDAIFKHLNKARNTLAHGGGLKDIEASLPFPSDHLIDVLGQLTWRALLFSYPRGVLENELIMAVPQVFVRKKVSAAFHMSGVAPPGADGEPDLEKFPKVTISLVPANPSTATEPPQKES